MLSGEPISQRHTERIPDMPLDSLDTNNASHLPLDPVLAKAARSIPIQGFQFTSEWSPSDDPGSGVEEWTLDAFIFKDSISLPENVPYLDIPEKIVVARATGLNLRPHFVMRSCHCSLFDVYDAYSDETMWLFETLYDETDGRDGLKDNALEIIDPIGGAAQGLVPEFHAHVRDIKFAKGFASRQDLAMVLDHLAQRFEGHGFASAILSLAGDAIEGCGFATAHQALKTRSILEKLGFYQFQDMFLLETDTASGEDVRFARMEEAMEHRIKRKPI